MLLFIFVQKYGFFLNIKPFFFQKFTGLLEFPLEESHHFTRISPPANSCFPSAGPSVGPCFLQRRITAYKKQGDAAFCITLLLLFVTVFTSIPINIEILS